MKRFISLSLLLFISTCIGYFIYADFDQNQKLNKTLVSKENFGLKAYMQQKKQDHKAGHAKLDAPELHALMQQQKRTPIDRNAPEYGPNYLMEEFKKLKQNRNGSFAAARVANTLNFIERGPGNVAGRTRGLLVDPDDPNHNTWYAGAASGGIWKTTNAGQSWSLISQDIPNLGTNTLAMSLANPNIIYAGTGEHFTNDIDGSGMFKSTDKGDSWFQIANPADYPDFKNVSRIIVDPNDENTVLATTRNSVWAPGNEFQSSIYKSTDGGQTWRSVYTSNDYRLDDLDFSPADFNIMYAAMQGKGVIKSEDGGETWIDASSGLDPAGRVEITVSPVNTSVIWASAQGSLSGTGSDLYVSKNAGLTWNPVFEENEENINFLGGQGWYDNIITAHPYDEDIVYVGGVNTFKFTLVEGSTNVSTIEMTQQDTQAFLSFINFSASYEGGILEVGSVRFENLTDVEVRFGEGTQMAHRFTVGKRGSGVPDADYVYEDYIEVPFQVWDVSNNQQLMVSFRDQQEDGEWNLLQENTASGDEANHSREYLFFHATPYSTDPNPDIAVDGGQANNQQYFLWPILSSGATFDENNLPQSKIIINKLDISALKKNYEVVSDGYNDFNGNNNYSNSDVVNKTGLHVDQHNMIMIKTDKAEEQFRILISNDGGVYLSEDSSDPALTDNTFTYASYGYNTTQFYGADKAPGEDRYIGGMQDNSTWFTPENVESNASTEYIFAFGGDGFESIWNNRDSDLMIGSIQFNAFRRSVDGGRTWQSATNGITDDGPFYSRLANNKSNPDRLFTIGSSGVWVSNDFGASWTGTPIQEQWSFNNNTDIKVSQSNPDIIWTGGNMSGSQRVFVSTDGGTSFTATSNYDQTPLGFVSGLGTHPTKDSTAFALFSFADRPKVLKTMDLGSTWSDISGFEEGSGTSNRGFPNVAVNCIQVFPNNTDRIWVGSELGIIESLDGGDSWGYLESNLPPVPIYDFKIQDDQVVIATYGRGIWSVTIPDIEREIIFAPKVASVIMNPEGSVDFIVNFTTAFDSVKFYANEQLLFELGTTEAGDSTISLESVNLEGLIPFNSIAYLDGEVYESFKEEKFVFDPRDVISSYKNDLRDASAMDDFVADGLDIRIEPDFYAPALHTDHNYDVSRDYIFLLPSAIEVSADNPILSYEDIAIVEPGVSGSEFGAADFWDYVVVEGSKDGNNWVALADGYDARKESPWLTAFQNQLAGREDRMIKQEINLTNTFNPGDKIFIRFRLFSDIEVVGWGWAIKNLSIQSDGEFESVLSTREMSSLDVYPNPAVDYILVNLSDIGTKQGTISLHDINGKQIIQLEFNSIEKPIKINRNELENGLYFLKVRTSEKSFTSKVLFK